ncbi:MAG TPA: fatty acid desaturase [Thermoanaerobaculia bacterium]|nr:fatty acid desaturase [Thermoanaerobaculia bacterium]
MSATAPAPAPTPIRRDEYPPTGGEHHWAKATRELRHRLAKEIPHEVLKELHRKSPARHLAIAARQFLILGAASAVSWMFPQPWIWIPAALVAGWTIFNFTVLLHEVVHRAVFNGPRPSAERALGILYAVPSGISSLQFTRWHLTHHAELGDPVADPKRHYLSPKINKAWYKLLYFTPALFPIYFRAARRETASYPPALQRRIARERLATIAFHVAVMAAIGFVGGWAVLGRVYLVPYFLVFPIAFALNRLGQHYAIVPEDPAKWGSVLKPSRFWDFWYLYSAYHLEHHYFTGVPFYNLRKLHFALRPFFESIDWRPTTYRRLLRQWIVENKTPHSDWSLEDGLVG